MSERLRLGIALFASLALAGGCHAAGPRAVRGGRVAYNEVVAQSFNEQLLLNLVRLRYRDTPFFLEISSVSTQHELGGSAGAAAGITDRSSGDVLSLDAAVEYAEKPTVTYAPLQGEGFVRQILSPIPVQNLVLLAQSGWSVERVLRCCVERLNELRNAPSASGPTPDYVPEFRDFARLSELLRRLQRADRLSFGVDTDTGSLVARFHPGSGEDAEAAEAKRLLGLPADRDDFRFAPRGLEGAEGELVVATRSLLGAMYYLSQAVEAPEADRSAGRVTVTRGAAGEVFDWQELAGGLMRVRSSEEAPEDAFVRVRYRGSWFFVADDDLESKTTFNLLVYLFNLQAGETKAFTPLLTLPVG